MCLEIQNVKLLILYVHENLKQKSKFPIHRFNLFQSLHNLKKKLVICFQLGFLIFSLALLDESFYIVYTLKKPCFTKQKNNILEGAANTSFL